MDGKPIPFEIIEEEIQATHPFAVRQLRSMLAVPYFEKALYELSDDEVTAERIQSLAEEVEKKVQGGLGPRPILSVPHIISDEASCYYHAYVVSVSRSPRLVSLFCSAFPGKPNLGLYAVGRDECPSNKSIHYGTGRLHC
jgi:hypothetical protein